MFLVPTASWASRHRSLLFLLDNLVWRYTKFVTDFFPNSQMVKRSDNIGQNFYSLCYKQNKSHLRHSREHKRQFRLTNKVQIRLTNKLEVLTGNHIFLQVKMSEFSKQIWPVQPIACYITSFLAKGKNYNKASVLKQMCISFF